MQSSWIPFCRWLQATWWAEDIRSSLWAYPFMQLIHFSGLSLWLGTNIVGDLRLLNIGKKPQTALDVRDELFAWNWIGFCIVVLGGILLFAVHATQYIVNPAFRVKFFMLIPVALVFHIFVQSKTRTWGRESNTPTVARLAGLVELLLWLSVVTAAVEIPSY
jgi:hypothetical protein